MNARTPSPWPSKGFALVRIIVGLLLAYHGLEVFQPKLMASYTTWDAFKGSSFATLLVYAGKGSELVAGLLLVAGLWARLAGFICVGTFAYITFLIGQGRFWYQDQHPFMFLLFGLLYLLVGAGPWSVDDWLHRRR
jgi:putative oxidoreductase